MTDDILWQAYTVCRNSLSVICMRATDCKTDSFYFLPLWENNVLMFENRNGVLRVHPLLHRKNNPEPVFVSVYGAKESITKNRFRQAGIRFLGSFKGQRTLEEGKGGRVLSLFNKVIPKGDFIIWLVCGWPMPWQFLPVCKVPMSFFLDDAGIGRFSPWSMRSLDGKSLTDESRPWTAYRRRRKS